MTEGMQLVHADGGACHGTPLVGMRCPKCGIAPDMQSTEFWPVAKQPSITCPICNRMSYNENDIEHGYCGYCHAFTATKAVVPAVPTEVEWQWDSPSSYWKVTSVQPAHQTGRRGETYSLLLIQFTHHKPNGDRLLVEAYIRERSEMLSLKAFLDAAIELPENIRVRIHTVKKAPWDPHTPRYQP